MGARQDWWDTSLLPEIFVPGRLQPTGQPFLSNAAVGRNDAPISWNAGVLYKLTPAVSPFFGVARSHLVNFSSEATQNGLAAPESALQYEGGVKANAFDDRLTVTAAGFAVTRNNVFALVGDVPVFNAQRTYGGEIDVDARPTPRWRITANATLQHATLTANPSNPAATGNWSQGVPATMAHLWTSYDFAVAGVEGFRIGAGLNYRDKMYGNLLNTTAIPSYVTADADISYTQGRWTVTVGAKNLSDTTYYVAANGVGAFVGDPFTVFGSVRFNLGG